MGGQAFEEKQRPEEVQWGGAKGGSAVLLSALRAVTDLSGLGGERGASAGPCDPGPAFMAAADPYQCGKRLQRPCVCTDVCLACEEFLPLKQSSGRSRVCASMCVCVQGV